MEKVLQDIVNLVSQHPAVQEIVLFGSRARGDAAEKADIDIAVVCPTMSEEDWVTLWHSLEHIETLIKIDMVNVDKAPDDLRENIQAEGKTLYERNKS